MKTLLFFMFISGTSFMQAQCSFTPEISPAPGEWGVIMMCPPEDNTMILSTMDGDAFQWYIKPMFGGGDWTAIAGATDRELEIDYYNYVVNDVKVAVTLEDCTEESEPVGIDGWAFLLPSLMTEFQNEQYQQIGDGEYNICPSNTVTFTINQPYTENINWFESGVLMDGFNETTLSVQESGLYSFDGCTDVCPDYCAVNSGYAVPPVQLNFGEWDFCEDLETNDLNRLGKFNAYPNPAQKFIQFHLNGEEKMNLTIFNVAGQTVDKIPNYESDALLNIANLPSGKYFVIAEGENVKFHTSFLIK